MAYWILTPAQAMFLFLFIPACMIAGSITLHWLATHSRRVGRCDGDQLVRRRRQFVHTVLNTFVKPFPILPFKEKKNLEGPGARARFVGAQIGYRLLIMIVVAVLFVAAVTCETIFHECGHGFVLLQLGSNWSYIAVGFFNGYTMGIMPMPFNPVNEMMVSIGGPIMSVIMGVIVLSFLAIPQVRRSFLASLFTYALAMACLSADLQAWFARSVNIVFGLGPGEGPSDLYNFLYFASVVPGGWNATGIIWLTFPLIVIDYVGVTIIGGKLWRVHYPKHRFSHVWFLLLINLFWWLNLLTQNYAFGLIRL